VLQAAVVLNSSALMTRCTRCEREHHKGSQCFVPIPAKGCRKDRSYIPGLVLGIGPIYGLGVRAICISLLKQLHSIFTSSFCNSNVQILHDLCPVLPLRALLPFCSSATAACLTCCVPTTGTSIWLLPGRTTACLLPGASVHLYMHFTLYMSSMMASCRKCRCLCHSVPLRLQY